MIRFTGNYRIIRLTMGENPEIISLGKKAEMEKRGEILDFAYALLQSTQCDEETVKLEIVAMLKNLSFYTEDYRAKIVRHEDLLIALTRVCNSSSSNVMREGVASVLRNLAMGTNVKVSLGRNPYILNTILALSSDPNVRIRRDAVNATLSLALTAENNNLLYMFVQRGAST